MKKLRVLVKFKEVLVLISMFLLVDVYAADIDILRERMELGYIQQGGSGSYVTTQSSNGSWSDIDYSNTNRTVWDPLKHVQRLKSMSIAYNSSSNSYYHSDRLLNGIRLGLTYWYQRAPRSDNWWFNDIGQQQLLGPTLILMQDFISQDLIDKGCTYLKDPYLTALNLVDVSEQTIHRGLLTNNEDDVIKGLKAIGSTVLVSEGDGIKSDYSFHQHEKQLYNGGYGLEFIDDITYWVYLTRGLSLSMGEEELDTYSNYLLEGMQWMTYKSSLDFSIVGRGISRKNKISGTGGLRNTLNKMTGLGDGLGSEYGNYRDHIDGGANSLVGNKHFWNSDYHSHRRDDYFVSVRMCSQRTLASETMNGENPKAHYLAYGAMSVITDYDEYYNIFPVWDWCRIPGTTSPFKAEPTSMPSWWSNYGKTSFVGGVSDGMYGVSAMDLDMDNVFGKKAWFFFDEEIVALGAGINSSISDKVATSINQTSLKNDVVSYEGGEKVYSKGSHILNNPEWVFHNNVLYVFPEQGMINMNNNTQSGSWSEINSQYSYSLVYKDVFSLWIDHGVKPANGSYYYSVVPGLKKEDVNSYLNNSSISMVSNTSRVQAVRNNNLKITGIIFYSSGELNVNEGLTISVDQPCILLLDEANNQLSASNPNQTLLNLIVNVSRSGVSEEVIFNFQEGTYAGRSIQKQLKSLSTDPCEGFNLSGETKNSDLGQSNGSITLVLTAGTEPYSFEWDDGSTNQNRTGLDAGEFSVTVTDANGCTVTESFVVIQNSIEVTSATVEDGVLTVGYLTTGDCSNISFSIYDDSNNLKYGPISNVESGFQVNLSSECPTCADGSYNISLSCGEVEVTEYFSYVSPIDPCEGFNLSGETSNSDLGQSNGAITLVLTAGTEPYSFEWDDGSTNQNRTGLDAGEFSVTVTDANGCTVTESFVVIQNSIEVTSATVEDGVLTVGYLTTGDCSNISFSIYDDSNNLKYGPISNIESGFQVNLSSECPTCADGSYNISLSCGEVEVTEYFSYVSPIDPCEGFSVLGEVKDSDLEKDNGAITLIISGGSAPFTIIWDDGEVIQNRANLGAGDYAVQVTDVNECSIELILTVDEKPLQFEIIRYYPNPTKGLVAIEFNSPNASTVDFIVNNQFDEEIKRSSMDCNVGKNKKTIDISIGDDGELMPEGKYVVVIKLGNLEDRIDIVKR